MSSTADTTLVISNKFGLHARAATLLVQLASKYQSDLFITNDGREINGKSIMGVLLLTASKGTTIEIRAEGPDCEDLVAAVTELVNNKFWEEQ